MNNKRERYTISRDRMADLRAATDSTDSTEAFGPRRNSNNSRQPASSPRRFAAARQSTEPQDEKSRVKVDLQSMDGFLEEIDSIGAAIRNVYYSIDNIGRVHDASLENSSRHASKLQESIDDISRQNQQIKKRIKAIESYCNAGSPDAKIRRAQADRVRQEFIQSIQRFQDMERGYAKKYRQQVERQIRIVKPSATDDEIERIIDSDQHDQVFAQSLMNSNRSGQAKDVLSEVQTRHDDIKKIERAILDLHQLFEDMQTIVEHQGQTLNQIEDHTASAVDDLEKGVKHVDDAIKIAKRTRAKKWCCFIIFIIILAVAAILIWWFAFNHKGVGDNP
ncbi:t-SNARE [Fennellomyces sp. T-0311]|nr:t-SNARE [Fennellomyces sp. T-0311]